MAMDNSPLNETKFSHSEVVIGSSAIVHLVALSTSASQGISQVIANVVLHVQRCLQLGLVLVGFDLDHLQISLAMFQCSLEGVPEVSIGALWVLVSLSLEAIDHILGVGV